MAAVSAGLSYIWVAALDASTSDIAMKSTKAGIFAGPRFFTSSLCRCRHDVHGRIVVHATRRAGADVTAGVSPMVNCLTTDSSARTSSLRPRQATLVSSAMAAFFCVT